MENDFGNIRTGAANFLSAAEFNPIVSEAIDLSWSALNPSRGGIVPQHDKETVVLASRESQAHYGAAYYLSKTAALYDSLLGRINLIDENPKSPKEIVDELLQQEKLSGKKLGDISIAAHGAAFGLISIDGSVINLGDPEMVRQFARLKGHIAPGSIIRFVSCQAGIGDIDADNLASLSKAAGVPVRAYTDNQNAAFIEKGKGMYQEGRPDGTSTANYER
jgi:hypothetical protein